LIFEKAIAFVHLTQNFAPPDFSQPRDNSHQIVIFSNSVAALQRKGIITAYRFSMALFLDPIC
jgi:hypothetical protein